MAATSRISWATALSANTPENFTLVLYADRAGQAAFNWSLDIAQLTPSGYVTIKTFTGSCPALGPGQQHRVSLQYTFPSPGNYYATTTSSYGATIGKQAFKVTAAYVLVHKSIQNDYPWAANEALVVRLDSYGDLPATVEMGQITVRDGGVYGENGSIGYTRERVLPTPYPSPIPLPAGQAKTIQATIGPLLNGYVEIEWPANCPQDLITDKRPLYHLGKVA